jgi:guanyl-specific ribonuclease Sa
MRLSRSTLPLILVALAGCATTESTAPKTSAAPPARPTVPAEIAAPETATLVLQLAAKGTQNYRCQSTSAGGTEWKLVAPEADLYRGADATGETAGKHGAGPSWTLNDGSSAKGDGAAAKKAASPETGSVAWLLIPAQSSGQPGALQGVTFVQRVGTHGGAAPATGCDAASVGAETKVPYTATYVFYR